MKYLAAIGFSLFCVGLYFSDIKGTGFWVVAVGVFLIVTAYVFLKIEAREAGLRALRRPENVRQPAEVSERNLIKYQHRSAELVNDPVFQEAQIYLGWGTRIEGEDSAKTDWWLEVPHVQCRCGYNFTLVEKDRERLRFPTKQNPDKVYLEVSCEKCKRRITVFRNS